MRVWLSLLIVIFCSVAHATPMQDHQITPEALAELATALGVPQNTDLVVETQKHWLRRPGQERWELVELPLDQKTAVINWATEQGLFAPWKPCTTTYDKALILGATTSRMQLRLDYLNELWEEGIRFDEIVWLVSERPLDARIDSLIDRCSDESEAAHFLWDEVLLPEEIRSLPVTFITVPMKSEGKIRPSTEDTLRAWLAAYPQPCKALFISDQPFCGYQFAIIKSTLPISFQFDLVGPGADPTSHPAAAAITLDSIARWFYQENLNAHK